MSHDTQLSQPRSASCATESAVAMGGRGPLGQPRAGTLLDGVADGSADGTSTAGDGILFECGEDGLKLHYHQVPPHPQPPPSACLTPLRRMSPLPPSMSGTRAGPAWCGPSGTSSRCRAPTCAPCGIMWHMAPGGIITPCGIITSSHHVAYGTMWHHHTMCHMAPCGI